LCWQLIQSRTRQPCTGGRRGVEWNYIILRWRQEFYYEVPKYLIQDCTLLVFLHFIVQRFIFLFIIIIFLFTHLLLYYSFIFWYICFVCHWCFVCTYLCLCLPLSLFHDSNNRFWKQQLSTFFILIISLLFSFSENIYTLK